MKNRSLLKRKIEIFYNDIPKKEIVKKWETNQEFQQNDIKKLNSIYYVEMFSTRLRVKKAFSTEQKKLKN